MSRGLNSRQKQFAAKVAAGKSLIGAYREVYQPENGKVATAYRNAKRKAKHPGIAVRIHELQEELLPAPEDMKAVYGHGLATIIQLSNSCEDGKVRLSAAQWLCAEAEKQEEKRRRLEAGKEEREQPREEIIAELRALYRKALPEPPELVVEVKEERGEE
jgi:hypothetical protein